VAGCPEGKSLPHSEDVSVDGRIILKQVVKKDVD
jgi:hypothetical protein